MGREYLSGQITRSIKENISKIKRMVLEFLYGQTEKDMKESGNKAFSMEKEE